MLIFCAALIHLASVVYRSYALFWYFHDNAAGWDRNIFVYDSEAGMSNKPGIQATQIMTYPPHVPLQFDRDGLSEGSGP